ncbi:hypothetical protein N7522_005600 [Penicillium canescens]|nr:hypothetical protein N7522_005600 [Penicillium canescens]
MGPPASRCTSLIIDPSKCDVTFDYFPGAISGHGNCHFTIVMSHLWLSGDGSVLAPDVSKKCTSERDATSLQRGQAPK